MNPCILESILENLNTLLAFSQKRFWSVTNISSIVPLSSLTNPEKGSTPSWNAYKRTAPLPQCFILLEQTGHYHRPLLQDLIELDLPVFVIPIQRRQAGMIKTDKRDALGLANQLYTQLELGAQAR